MNKACSSSKIGSNEVREEVLLSTEGELFLTNIREVYILALRIQQSMQVSQDTAAHEGKVNIQQFMLVGKHTAVHVG